MRTYSTASFLFVKIFLSVHFTRLKLKKLKATKIKKINFNISLALTLSSGWQQLMGKNYSLLCVNGVMLSNFFVVRNTKNCRQHAFFMKLRFDILVCFVTKWREQIVNNEKDDVKSWEAPDFTTLKMPLTAKSQVNMIGW